MDNSLLQKLKPLRERIDSLDEQILSLLMERARTAQQVGLVKEKVEGPALRPEREAQVIRRLQSLNEGPLPPESVASIWTQIMSACRRLEQTNTVAFLGPTGTFSEQAVYAHFGDAVQSVPCTSIDDVFRAVEAGRTDFGIVPVENSTEGAINRTLDLLLTASVNVLGEHSLVIRHNLMAKQTDLSRLTHVYAHAQALAQCQEWLTQYMPHLERVSVSSNAEAARLASQSEHVAAIAGEQAAQHWGLVIHHENIQDDPHNRTRFLAIGRIETWPSGLDKTSLIFAVGNRSGAVYKMLAPLADQGVSMTRFESRPARNGQWDYYFYVDIEGHHQDPKVHKALDVFRQQADFFKLLGSYPVQPSHD